MADIKIQIDTELTWEADELLEQVKTKLYKEVGGGRVTLYAEMDGDTNHIKDDIQAILDSTERIAKELEEQEDERRLWEQERRVANAEYEGSVL